MTPSICRIVHYTLSQHDAQLIDQQHPGIVDGRQVRNSALAGDVFPALIVRTWGGTTVNLKIFLDGETEYWATSRQEGDGEGRWSWPPRV